MDVIYRAFKKGGEVVALFPSLPGTNDATTCDSYMTIGQHGAASVGLVKDTRPANEAEAAAMGRELRAVGYEDLKPVLRFSRRHYQARREALKTGGQL